MSVAVAILKMVEEDGLTYEQAVRAAARMEEALATAKNEAPNRSSAAERQARYRQRNKANSVTRDVTRDVTIPPQSDITCRNGDVTRDASSRIGAPAEPELTNLELYPEKQERKNIVGFPKERKTQPRNQKPSYSPLYELVWQTLPRHPNSSKADGYREFLRLSEEDQNRALDGAMAWQEIIIETRQRQPGYEPPHMSTWLHKRRFDDALDAKPQFRMYGQ